MGLLYRDADAGRARGFFNDQKCSKLWLGILYAVVLLNFRSSLFIVGKFPFLAHSLLRNRFFKFTTQPRRQKEIASDATAQQRFSKFMWWFFCIAGARWADLITKVPIQKPSEVLASSHAISLSYS